VDDAVRVAAAIPKAVAVAVRAVDAIPRVGDAAVTAAVAIPRVGAVAVRVVGAAPVKADGVRADAVLAKADVVPVRAGSRLVIRRSKSA
jgi:hypothetical protein